MKSDCIKQWANTLDQLLTPPANFADCHSETAKYRHLTVPFCVGCGVDIGSQGDPVVPWAVSLDLPETEWVKYSSEPPKGAIQLRGFADQLPFADNSLDWLYASHILEDFFEWMPVLKHWVSKLKPKGTLIILVPDKGLWAAALAKGQPPNCSHRHEAQGGELSSYAPECGLRVIKDDLTAQFEGDYSILFIAQKL